ncbi:MAG: SUMF1/EgtB/PvdO family nonheme iron enzyme, partial [Planctomycetes bacterium]|nr:SUMF1/EgtB/PvdO family nonheme iron enzyme [Planctomycetota bacterium]
MKCVTLAFLFAAMLNIAVNGQTLQVDPIFVGGNVSFDVTDGTPNGSSIVCYSTIGSGPFIAPNGLTLDLSTPIGQLRSMALDNFGNGALGPFAVPSSVSAGSLLWFQAVDVNISGNPNLRTTNMVPITVNAMPPPPFTNMVAITGGTFEMGDHASVGYFDERPVHSVTLDSFYMGKYEVS